MVNRKTKHPQLGFIDFYGEPTLVDEEVFHLLSVLKMHGVCTQFSCQGDIEHDAYVLVKLRTLWSLLWRIGKTWFSGGYSKESVQLLRLFIKGYKEARITWYRGSSDPNVSVANGKDAYYCVEPTYATGSGFRVTFRWPPEDTETIYNMLLETKFQRN